MDIEEADDDHGHSAVLEVSHMKGADIVLCRTVNTNFSAIEHFMGFYQTENHSTRYCNSTLLISMKKSFRCSIQLSRSIIMRQVAYIQHADTWLLTDNAVLSMDVRTLELTCVQ